MTDACSGRSRRAWRFAHDLDHTRHDVRRRNLDGAAALPAGQKADYTLCLWCVQPQPNRRHRVTLVPIVDSSQLSQKRKRSVDGSDSEGENDGSQDDEDEEADVEEDYTAPKSSQPKKRPTEKAPAAAAGDAKAAPKKRGRPPGTGKPRAPKTISAVVGKARRGRPRKGAAEFDAEQVAKETNITNDNPLFSEWSSMLFGRI